MPLSMLLLLVGKYMPEANLEPPNCFVGRLANSRTERQHYPRLLGKQRVSLGVLDSASQ